MLISKDTLGYLSILSEQTDSTLDRVKQEYIDWKAEPENKDWTIISFGPWYRGKILREREGVTHDPQLPSAEKAV